MNNLNQKKRHYLLAVFITGCYALCSSQNAMVKEPALVDFEAYQTLLRDVKEHRKHRMVTAEEFVEMSKKPNVIILDTRSDSMYKALHVKGAIHLNFSDFTQANLARIIPSADTRILIY